MCFINNHKNIQILKKVGFFQKYSGHHLNIKSKLLKKTHLFTCFFIQNNKTKLLKKEIIKLTK